jgi:excisionase family DNA binding protein
MTHETTPGQTSPHGVHGTEVLTPEEVAAILKMKPVRILEAARAGRIRSFKYGKFVRFTRADVDAFITAHRRRSR